MYTLNSGGHRLPMIWHWPEGINPGENTENVVSYIDIYATLAKIIGMYRSVFKFGRILKVVQFGNNYMR